MAAIAQAAFLLNTGEVVDMKTSLTEGTVGELKTSTDYAVAATSLGQYAEGKTITQILQPVGSDKGIAYAYINRRGSILCVLPVEGSGAQWAPAAPLWSGVLQAGDTIQVMTNSTTDREFAYSCVTNQGVHAIFAGTPGGAADTDLTHILSGQGLGASLTNQAIVKHFATSVDGSKIDSGNGVYLLNDRGLPMGGCAATNPQNLQTVPNSMGGAMIGLNWVARVTTNA